MKAFIKHIYFAIENYLFPEYCGLVERRQLICFLLTAMGEMVLMTINFLLIDASTPTPLVIYDFVHLPTVLVLFLLLWRRKLNIHTGLLLFFSFICVKLSFEALYYSCFHMNEEDRVMGNFMICLIIATGAIASNMKKFAVLLSLVVGACLVYCLSYFAENDLLGEIRAFGVIYLLFIFVVIFNMDIISVNLRQPKILKAQERKALEMLGNLKDTDRDKVHALIERLSHEQKRNIRLRVSEYMRQEELENLAYDEICPDLTSSEKEICKLILQNKSLKQICAILGKTESNITSQRAHIRKKLGMTRREELHRVLTQKMLELRRNEQKHSDLK